MTETTVKWSPVNKAYLMLFGSSVINVFSSKDDLLNHLKTNGLKLKGNKVVKSR